MAKYGETSCRRVNAERSIQSTSGLRGADDPSEPLSTVDVKKKGPRIMEGSFQLFM